MIKFSNKKRLFCSIVCSIVLCSAFFLFISKLENRLIWSVRSAIKSNKLFRGVVLIAKDDRIIYEKSYLDECLCDQQFLVASLVKQMTSTLILKQAEKGKLNISEKANKYLKEGQKIHDEITVHHLMSHTSGVMNGRSVKFPPGTQYEYSNTAYVILGYILKNITGKEFDDLADEMFRSLEMDDSFLIDEEFICNLKNKHPSFMQSLLFDHGHFCEISNTSKRSYIMDRGKKVFFANSCGGLVSTAYDLNQWNYMLHNGKILSPKMYQKMISKVIKSDFPRGFYGYGVCIPNDEEIYHIGYVSGYKSTLSYFPKYKISLVILENISVNDYEPDFKMHNDIRKIVLKYVQRLEKNRQ